jgi:hypothetical protein
VTNPAVTRAVTADITDEDVAAVVASLDEVTSPYCTEALADALALVAVLRAGLNSLSPAARQLAEPMIMSMVTP